MNVAAVDIGTNSVRLLVSDGTRDLERTSVITRLGQGVDRTGRLDDEAIERTVRELARLRGLIEVQGVERVRAVATSAARDATNRDDFFTPAAEALGHPLELLEGADEGQLAFRGATSWLDPARGPFLVVDIGGGSTELVVGSADSSAARSIDVDCVRLTEAYLHHDPPQPEELTNAIGIVTDHLDDVRRELPEIDDVGTIVGVAGTITTVAAVELGLLTYDRDRTHGFRLTRSAAEDVFRTLATEPLADRVHNPGLPPARADVIVGGCCILVALLRGLHAGGLLVSERDILDGIAASLLS
jgi:exopolyphosphatase / guanosine-5'-triphosphate,3'-diphosphate pyrophosphatase